MSCAGPRRHGSWCSSRSGGCPEKKLPVPYSIWSMNGRRKNTANTHTSIITARAATRILRLGDVVVASEMSHALRPLPHEMALTVFAREAVGTRSWPDSPTRSLHFGFHRFVWHSQAHLVPGAEPIDQGVVSRLNDLQRRRGPDGRGYGHQTTIALSWDTGGSLSSIPALPALSPCGMRPGAG